MAKKCLMTWQAKTRRWAKKHKAKLYFVSCKQLCVKPETKEASIDAANAWWEAKLAELESSGAPQPTPEDLRINAFKVWGMVQDWQHLDEASREKLVDSLVGAGQYRKLKEQANSSLDAILNPAADRQIAAQVDSWLGMLKGATKAGQMSGSRWDSYRRNIEKFKEFMGASSPIDAINEARVEGFFNDLSVHVGAGKYSPSYAHTLLMTAKQFIAYLAEKKLIVAPGNLRSRRLRFNHSAAAKVEVFSAAEVQAMLKACEGFSDKTKLYLLLMLNCGMYQNDIAEMLKEEVNWKAGTITRARSKTRARGGPMVTYPLWSETFRLLKKCKADKGDLALTTDEGKPLVFYSLKGEDASRYDVVQSAWSRLAAKMGLKKIRLGMKHLRKTSATMLASHEQYKYYVGHFLADSPKGMDQKHYVKPSQEEFDKAIVWLGEQYLQ
jgi:integrase